MILSRGIKITAILVIITMFFVTAFSSAALAANAGDIGTVNSPIGLNVRSGAGTGFPAVTGLSDGERVKILGETRDSGGSLWYNIETLTGVRGFVSASYLAVSANGEEPAPVYVTDGNFESYLSAQGFPESYKPYLRELHAAYPKWLFVAKNTGLDWNEVITRESKIGISLVAGSLPNCYKSNDPAAFNSDGSYKSFDSGGWHAASKSAIEYYMDPRNFLTKNRIHQFISHRFDPTVQTIDGLNAQLRGTFLGGAYPKEEDEITEHSTYAEVIYSAGTTSGVNPYVLSAMILVEQGTQGTGGCISGTVEGYEGYYNYYNIGAYKAGTLSAVQRGLSYAKGTGSYLRPWDTRAKSITGGASWYFNNYVERGKDSLYLKKWNVMNGLSYVGVGQYMTNIQGAYIEASKLYKSYEGVLDSVMTFEIPVFSAMPEKAAPLPTETAQEEPDQEEKDRLAEEERLAAEKARLEAEQAAREALDKNNAEIAAGLAGSSVKLKSEYYTSPKGKKSIRVYWEKARINGISYKVDYYEVFRSEKRYSGYTLSPFFTTKSGKVSSYINSKQLISGKTYYYKIRGVRILKDYDGNETKYYTPFSNRAYRMWS